MLRNIPNKYMQAALLEEIDAAGFAETYDFFYLPMDVHNRANVGYAFVNFLRHEDMVHFAEMFTYYVFQKHPSLKIARVSPAHIQGLIENLRHFSNRAVTWARNNQYRPIVQYQGRQRDLCELLAELPPADSEQESDMVFNACAPEFTPGSYEWSKALNPDAAEFCPMGDMAAMEGFEGAYETDLDLTGYHMALSPEAAELGLEMMEAVLASCEDPDQGNMDVPPGLEELFAEEHWDSGEQAPTSLGDTTAVPCDAESVPRQSASAGSSSAPAELPESFSAAKAGLQEAVSEWLREEKRSAATGDTSAAGDSSTRGSSGHPSPRTCLEGGREEAPTETA